MKESNICDKQASQKEAAAPSSDEPSLYLLQFASSEYAQFRLAEFVSLAGMFNCRFATVFTGKEREDAAAVKDSLPELVWSDELFASSVNAGVHDCRDSCSGEQTEKKPDGLLELCAYWWRSRPLVVVRCDDETKLRQVVERSAIVKRLLRVWHSTDSLSEMLTAVSGNLLAEELAKVGREFSAGSWSSWRMCVEVVNISVSMEAKVDIVEQFGSAGLEMPGRVDLKRPEFELYYVEHWRYDLSCGGVTDKTPVRVYMAQRISIVNLRTILPHLCLSRRVFIGNTSMNVQLAFVMCNLARVAPGHLVIDPFVGSGSILVSAGYIGAYCVGQDVDYNIVLGLGKSTKAEMRKQKRTDGECLAANFDQYGLCSRFVDCLVGDASQHIGLWRRAALFDAVLTDPPYGIRERSRKVKRDPLGGPKKLDQEYFPPKEHYSLGDSVSDLLSFAALRLAPGGRCVFWFPVIQSDYHGQESLPRHPRFRLIASVELPLNQRTSRVLVCMERREDSPGCVAGAGDEADWNGVSISHDHQQLRSIHFRGPGVSKATTALQT